MKSVQEQFRNKPFRYVRPEPYLEHTPVGKALWAVWLAFMIVGGWLLIRIWQVWG